MERRDYTGIDVTKFICAILIVCIHVAPLDSVSTSLNSLLVNVVARVAVPFFFVCGGFFLFGKIDFANPDYQAIFKYALKMLKFYLIWNVIFFPFVLRDILAGGNIANSLLIWAKNMVFTSGYGLLWYLKASAVAVLIISLFIKWRMSLGKMIVIGLILYVLGLFGHSYFGLLKPLQNISVVWSALGGIGEVINTTRNGVFEGLLFMTIGAALSKAKKQISVPVSLVGLCASVAALFVEVWLITKFGLRRDMAWDMYLMLVPCSIFLFELSAKINFPHKTFCKSLRTLSTLVYFSHMLSYELICSSMQKAEVNSLIVFATAIASTLVLDVIIMLLARVKQLSFIKKIYS